MAWKERHAQLVNIIDRHSHMVTFLVGKEEKKMKCARLCMSGISSAFESMLYGNINGTDENQVIWMKDVEPAIFQFIIDWAYGKEVNFNDTNIISIMRIADKYQIRMLFKKCDEQFTKIVNVDTICNILNDSVQQGCLYCQYKILKLFKSYFGYYTQQIIQTEGFMTMNLNSMNIFLKLDCLNVSECKIYDMILKWTKYQTNKSSLDKNYDEELLKSVCKNVRFATMEPVYLASKRTELSIVLSSEDFVNILCHGTIQDSELTKIIARKFILKSREFN